MVFNNLRCACQDCEREERCSIDYLKWIWQLANIKTSHDKTIR